MKVLIWRRSLLLNFNKMLKKMNKNWRKIKKEIKTTIKSILIQKIKIIKNKKAF